MFRELSRMWGGALALHTRPSPHSQNAPFSILTLTRHVMILSATQVSGKIDDVFWWANRNHTKSKQSEPKKRERQKKKENHFQRDLPNLYCSPPNLEFWFNGVVPWPTWQQTTITICESETLRYTLYRESCLNFISLFHTLMLFIVHTFLLHIFLNGIIVVAFGYMGQIWKQKHYNLMDSVNLLT